MPAYLPGDTDANNIANPSAGRPVAFSSFNGPKGSPFDAKAVNPANYLGGPATWIASAAPVVGLSLGIGLALQTGPWTNAAPVPYPQTTKPTPPQAILDYIPGVTKPDGTAAVVSTLVAIGGGKSIVTPVSFLNPAGEAGAVPYAAGFGLLAAGGGGSRDAGAGPAFTGFQMQVKEAAGAVADGGVIVAGFINRTGAALALGQRAFSSLTAPSEAPA